MPRKGYASVTISDEVYSEIRESIEPDTKSVSGFMEAAAKEKLARLRKKGRAAHNQRPDPTTTSAPQHHPGDRPQNV